jgi:heavy metal sensor kinase
MLETVRTRLTLWYVSLLAAILLVVLGMTYVLLARALYVRIDDSLQVLIQIVATSLTNDLAEGQQVDDAARSTASELASRSNLVAIYDASGRLLGEAGREDDIAIRLPALDAIPSDGGPALVTIVEADDLDDRHRLALQRVRVPPGVEYIIVVGSSLEPTDEELESLRGILAYVVPLSLVVAGLGGWFLARRSLAPVVAMADRARQIGVGSLNARLPVANPRDELGLLAATFNELLSRLEASVDQQRQFMADASHELRTPVTIARTAASVALQQPTRGEAEYRETLAIIEQETIRLSRIVDDLFTLTRADAGTYPVRKLPMYLDELIDDVVRATRVVAATRDVSIVTECVHPASYTGDEDLIRRLVLNVLDNAIRYSPPGSSVRVALDRSGAGYAVSVSDQGPGIAADAQARIFERFYRVDAARTRDAGAGLGLALARWIAQAHDGEVALAASSRVGSTFVITLPSPVRARTAAFIFGS